ncbi:hypothetical protein B0H16DRAFT_1469537 [Mycena metata]|uniref:Uncharacterized protein n=1 Tax=Mycena metata TaxID=1033252 RepID=A0AAD7HXK7_9AGAR|nr:hypothetical protein B0H16DRAFT_1469537 [Mycena metata]
MSFEEDFSSLDDDSSDSNESRSPSRSPTPLPLHRNPQIWTTTRISSKDPAIPGQSQPEVNPGTSVSVAMTEASDGHGQGQSGYLIHASQAEWATLKNKKELNEYEIGLGRQKEALAQTKLKKAFFVADTEAIAKENAGLEQELCHLSATTEQAARQKQHIEDKISAGDTAVLVYQRDHQKLKETIEMERSRIIGMFQAKCAQRAAVERERLRERASEKESLIKQLQFQIKKDLNTEMEEYDQLVQNQVQSALEHKASEVRPFATCLRILVDTAQFERRKSAFESQLGNEMSTWSNKVDTLETQIQEVNRRVQRSGEGGRAGLATVSESVPTDHAPLGVALKYDADLREQRQHLVPSASTGTAAGLGYEFPPYHHRDTSGDDSSGDEISCPSPPIGRQYDQSVKPQHHFVLPHSTYTDSSLLQRSAPVNQRPVDAHQIPPGAPSRQGENTRSPRSSRKKTDQAPRSSEFLVSRKEQKRDKSLNPVKKAVRELTQKLLGIKSDRYVGVAVQSGYFTSRAEAVAYATEATAAVHPTLKPFCPCWEDIKGPWNLALEDLFIARFKKDHSEHCEDENYVRNHFKQRLETLRSALVVQVRQLDRPDLQEMTASNSRRTERRRTLFRRRYGWAEDNLETIIQPDGHDTIGLLCEMVKLLGTDGMSSDESDGDSEVPFTVAMKTWRSPDIVRLLKWIDVHRPKQTVFGERLPGNPPRRRRRLRYGTAPTSLRRAIANLPLNFYDPVWYRGLSAGQQRRLGATESRPLPLYVLTWPGLPPNRDDDDDY